MYKILIHILNNILNIISVSLFVYLWRFHTKTTKPILTNLDIKVILTKEMQRDCFLLQKFNYQREK